VGQAEPPPEDHLCIPHAGATAVGPPGVKAAALQQPEGGAPRVEGQTLHQRRYRQERLLWEAPVTEVHGAHNHGQERKAAFVSLAHH
jgi:hypothetical protein